MHTMDVHISYKPVSGHVKDYRWRYKDMYKDSILVQNYRDL